MSASFAHLHLHTEFSMLDGAARVEEVVKRAASDGQPAIAITDHGNMYGVLDFYKAAHEAGVKPIIGIEAYMAAESRLERPLRRGRMDDTGGEVEEGDKLYYHLTLLAENDRGYKNLLKLSSEAYLSGYWYKPRADWELLERYHEGVIATTGCLGGLVNQALLRGDVELATAHAVRLQEIFGRDNLFVELQDHGLEKQRKTNPQLVEIARRIGAPLLATNDSHYTTRDDHLAHDALLCVQTGSSMDDPKRFRFEGSEHYLKTAAEMRQLFSDHPQACDNTLWVAERADVNIELGKSKLPAFPLPEGFSGSDAYLRHLTYQGARGALRGARAGPCGRKARLRARGRGVDGLLGLFPGRAGTSSITPASKKSGWGRAGQRRRLLRRLLLAHRRPRPDPLRPAVRTVPQPRAQADARHRHGLRRALPGRDDPLRLGALGLGPRGPDRHFFDYQGQGGGAGRGPGARLPLQRRRPHSQIDAAVGHGPGHAAVGVLPGGPQARRRVQGRHRTAGHVRRPTPTSSGWSTWPWGSRASAARTASTPPRS